MSLILPGADTRPIVGQCRVCKTKWREGVPERVMARHMQKCAQEHWETVMKPQRDKLKFLEPWDPEYDEWYRAAYKRGEIKPSTDPV